MFRVGLGLCAGTVSKGKITMQFRHPAIGLLYGVLIFSGSAGCVVNDRIAMRRDATPERLISIARVFKSQGHLEHADSMYREALARDSSCEIAQNGIAHIVALNQTRSFDAARPSATRQEDLPPTAEDVQIDANPEALVSTPTLHSFASAPDTAIATLEIPILDTSKDEVTNLESLPFETSKVETPATVVPNVKTVATAGSDSLEDILNPESAAIHNEPLGVAYLLPEDRGTRLVSAIASDVGRPTTSDVIADWLEEPSHHVESLLTTLRYSDNPEQRALAATLLAEAPTGDTRVNSALENHCTGSEAVVAAAAVESLLLRGFTSESSVQAVLVLAEHADLEIRSQVCSCMRLLAGTPWELNAIQMLTNRLDDSSPAVRGMAALTLGDFDGESDVILERLVDRYSLETDRGVRHSLELTAERLGTLPVDKDTAESVGG